MNNFLPQNNSWEQFSRQKVMVTGGSGFIGFNLCRRLCANGAEVHSVSRKLTTSNIDNLHCHRGNIGEIETVRELLGTVKPDVIFHLASHVTGSRNLDFVLPTLHSNLVSTVNLLTAATEVGCRRIVLAGSLEEPEANQLEITPSSPYAAAKWASSNYASMFYELYQTPVVIARLFMVYGPGQRNLHQLIPYVILSSLQGQAPKLSSGKRQVDWIYIDDVIEGLLMAAQVANIEGCTFDIGSGTLVPIYAVVQQLIDLVNPETIPLLGALPDRPRERVRVANTTHTYEKLGWQPLIPLQKGLELTVDWYTKYQREILDFKQQQN